MVSSELDNSDHAIRRISNEVEAKLTPHGSQSTTGKIECKTYGDSTGALRARVRNLSNVASDYPLRLFVNNIAIGDLERTRDKAELELDSREGNPIPTIVAGDEAQIRSGDLVLSQGTFYED